jgi:NACHT domain
VSDGNLLAGAGKTKLVSRVIDHISNGPGDQALAYFYCNRNEDTRRDPGNILRSFTKQLSISPDEDAIQNALVEVYEKKRKTGFASAKLTFEESQSLLLTLVQSYSKTTLVLDALDESEEGIRGDLIDFFNHLINKSQHLKIFISSRRDDDIKRQLEKEANVGIEATDNENDISKFVAEKIDQGQKRRRRAISEGLRNEIIQTLLEKSQGM